MKEAVLKEKRRGDRALRQCLEGPASGSPTSPLACFSMTVQLLGRAVMRRRWSRSCGGATPGASSLRSQELLLCANEERPKKTQKSVSERGIKPTRTGQTELGIQHAAMPTRALAHALAGPCDVARAAALRSSSLEKKNLVRRSSSQINEGTTSVLCNSKLTTRARLMST
jgi:hypothetical protein